MVKISLDSVKKAVNEAINEIKLGSLNNLKGNNSTTQPQTQTQAVANQPTSKEEGKQFPVVSYCLSEKKEGQDEPVVRLGLSYIYDQHLPILQKLYKKLDGVFTISKTGKNTIEIDIPESALDTFKKVVPTLKEALRRASSMTRNANYDEKKLDNLANDILTSISNAPSYEELQEYNKQVANNWRELASKMNDPAIKAKLRGLGAFYLTNTEDGGIDHKLSDTNKYLILRADQNATYVTQEAGWAKLNRTIKDPSKYILVKVPAHKAVDMVTKDAVARRLGYGTYANYKKLKRAGTIQRGRIHEFEMQCQAAASGPDFAYLTKMYDVANTEVIPGMEDIFNTQEGYVNNLFGIPNDVAAANKEKTEKEIKDYKEAHSGETQNVTTGRTDAMLTNTLNVILRACIAEGVPFKESGNISEDIGSAIYQYELKRANTEYHIEKPADAEMFAKSIAACVSQSLGLENSALVSYTKEHDMSDTDAQDAWGEFFGIINAISSKKGLETGTADIKPIKLVAESDEAINEGIGSISSFGDFKAFLKGIGINVKDSTKNDIEEEVVPENIQESILSFGKRLDTLKTLNNKTVL